MKKTIFLIAAMAFVATGAFAQRGQKKNAGAYTYPTECMGVEMDGSQTLKAWGSGKNRVDAVEQARKYAVRDVLFKGILEGKQECNVKPIISEVNAQEKYEDYFFKFFADNGPYKEFVNNKDESTWPKIVKDKKKNGSEVTEGVIVRVLRAQLKQKMITDKILNPNP
ncbi:MAG: hypothetical protein ACXVC6_14685 [Bacteroidia bacterium]